MIDIDSLVDLASRRPTVLWPVTVVDMVTPMLSAFVIVWAATKSERSRAERLHFLAAGWRRLAKIERRKRVLLDSIARAHEDLARTVASAKPALMTTGVSQAGRLHAGDHFCLLENYTVPGGQTYDRGDKFGALGRMLPSGSVLAEDYGGQPVPLPHDLAVFRIGGFLT